MWPFTKRKKPGAPLFLTNTLSGLKERFAPLKAGAVRIYSCGPTVYGPQHIGNMRSAVFADTVARLMTTAGYSVRRVINITDVGHLVGDGDEGEDKMQVGAKLEKTTPEAIAKRYTERYLHDIRSLNVDADTIHFPRASDYIKEQIEMIKALEKKALAYRADDGIYFDTKKFPEYGKLGGVMEVKLMAGARVKMVKGKKNLHDFALWRFAKKGDLQIWDSPWGAGNPGWSIECSAMAKALLGETIDIHTGGEDHIQVHHNNEIAQSEGANGRILARFWLHHAFLTIEGQKISKSLGNTYTLEDVVSRGVHPLALRFFFLQAHYKTPVAFSWGALTASEVALRKLWRMSAQVKQESKGRMSESDERQKVDASLKDDFGTPAAIATLFEALQSEDLSAQEKWGVIETADAVLGLLLTTPPETKVVETVDRPSGVQQLLLERQEARANHDYKKADELRMKIESYGYRVDDSPEGVRVSRK